MEDNKYSIQVISVLNYMDKGFKIFKLKFPIGVIPSINMVLNDSDNVSYTISGIIFESGRKDIWDCKLNDNLNKIVVGMELYTH